MENRFYESIESRKYETGSFGAMQCLFQATSFQKVRYFIRMEDLSGFAAKLQSDKCLGKWTYYQLKEYIEQKAEQYGIKVELVNSVNTSITCSHCGTVSKENRPKGDKGAEYFKCVNCGYHVNADFNAARNISMSDPIKKRKGL